MLAVSTDSHRDSRKMIAGVQEAYGLTIDFPLLEDADHRVIDRYGLLNMKTAPGPSTRHYANAATFIIDRDGIVRWRMVGENWKLRPSNELIAAALERVRAGADATSLTMETFFGPDEAARGGEAQVDGDDVAALDGMVLIPGGMFRMGSKGRSTGDSPDHEVHVDPFHIDAREVTNAQYRRFLEAVIREGHARCHPAEAKAKDHTPRYWTDPRFNGASFPVVGVDWYDAYAYAAHAGKHLPTEAQWEKAARSGEGLEYPWGRSDEATDHTRANFDPLAGEGGATLADQGQARPFPAPTGPKAVGSYPAYSGIHDIVGNVEEWCFDWYDADYYRRSPRENPAGPSRGALKVVRGGSWHHGKGRASTRYTHAPDERTSFLGFRCVRSVSRPPG